MITSTFVSDEDEESIEAGDAGWTVHDRAWRRVPSGVAEPTVDYLPRDTRFPNLAQIGSDVTPQRCFYEFITPEMVGGMFQATSACMPPGKRLTHGEMKQFLGVIWTLNIFRGKNQTDLWSRRSLTPISAGINMGSITSMGYTRYKTILKAFQVVPFVRAQTQVKRDWSQLASEEVDIGGICREGGLALAEGRSCDNLRSWSC